MGRKVGLSVNPKKPDKPPKNGGNKNVLNSGGVQDPGGKGR